MKFSFHIDDIEEVSSVWFEILNAKAYEKLVSRVKGIDQDEFSSLDHSDMRYIERVITKHPKLKRLMPLIIKESLILYGYNEASGTGICHEEEQLSLF
jgi:hypothetical protein